MLLPFFHAEGLEAGVDEAGRGCYAGPVFAAAVILPINFEHPLLNDSKQLKEKDRNLLRPIIEKEALAWSVQQANESEIDRLNILQATYLAMHRAIASLALAPQFLLIDGKWFKPFAGIQHQCVVKGDATYASIAAASILAKTHRDQYMAQLHLDYPQYHWDVNKVYGTAVHRQAIAEYGLCGHHRKSFNNLPTQIALEFGSSSGGE